MRARAAGGDEDRKKEYDRGMKKLATMLTAIILSSGCGSAKTADEHKRVNFAIDGPTVTCDKVDARVYEGGPTDGNILCSWFCADYRDQDPKGSFFTLTFQWDMTHGTYVLGPVDVSPGQCS